MSDTECICEYVPGDTMECPKCRPKYKVAYIYPQFYRAIRDLIESINASEKQAQLISKWFKNHVFEVGVDHKISDIELEHFKGSDLKKWINEKSRHKLVDLIQREGLFCREETRHEYGLNVRTMVLVFGKSDFTGPAKRGES